MCGSYYLIVYLALIVKLQNEVQQLAEEIEKERNLLNSVTISMRTGSSSQKYLPGQSDEDQLIKPVKISSFSVENN